MRENIQSHEKSNERPVGRFLIGLGDYRGQNDPFEYAKDFARTGENFGRYKHKSCEVPGINDLEVDGRKVYLEFAIERYAYVWRIRVAAERVDHAEAISKNIQPHGGEKYELHCSEPNPHGEYYERGTQGYIIRERRFHDEESMARLQGVVEALLSKPDERTAAGLAYCADILIKHETSEDYPIVETVSHADFRSKQ